MTQWTTEQHQRLIDLILLSVEGATVDEEGLTISGPDGGFLGLPNLTKSIKHVPESEWPDFLKPYLVLFAGPPEVPSNFEKARAHLRVRLTPNASEPGWALHDPVCDGLDKMLLYKTDCGAATVSPALIEGWGVPTDQVWAEALEHTIWDEPRERQIVAKDEMRIIWVRGSFWTSSLLLSLGHLLSPGNRFGAVVMIPLRDALLYTEVNDEHVVLDSAGMIDIGGRWYVDEPGPISADLFWYRDVPDGPKISRIVRERNGRFQPCWGRDFSAALAELSSDLETLDSDRRRHRKAQKGASTMPR